MKEKAIGKIIAGLLICLMIVSLFGGIIDATSATNEKTTVSVTESSPWFTKGSNSGHPELWYSHTYQGHNYISTYVGGMSSNPSQPDCWAKFKPYLSQSGKYEVYAYFYAGKDTSTKVPFTVKYDGGSTTIKVNQYRASPAWKEKYLGTWDFKAGADTCVKVTDATGEPYDGRKGLTIGAIKFMRKETVPTPVITGIDPSQPTASPTRQWITIIGTGFVSDSTVTLRIGSSTYPIPADRTEFKSSTQIRVYVGLTDPGTWSARVTNPGNRLSNLFSFTVKPKIPSLVHDMAVTDVYTSPDSPNVGQLTTIYVTVKNKGNQQEKNVPVKAYVDGYQVGSAQYVTLSAGKSTTKSFTWTPSTAKTYSVKGEVGIVSGETDTSDNKKAITVSVQQQNQLPTTPSIPSGTSSGYTGTSYGYSTSATDPDGDQVKYTFDWGEGPQTTTGFYNSGATATASHSWSNEGTYHVKLKATDSKGASSGWSSSKTVTITKQNRKPTAYIDSISPNPAKQGQTVSFNGRGTDPDGDSLTTYHWRSSKNGFLSSSKSFSRSDLSVGTHTIYFKVKDSHGLWSNEATKSLTIKEHSIILIKIDDWGVEPREVKVSEKVTLKFKFTNTGDIPWTVYAALSLRRPDNSVDNSPLLKAVTLSPTQQGSAEWTYTMDMQGKWDVVFGVWKEEKQKNSLISTGWLKDFIKVVEAEHSEIPVLKWPLKGEIEDRRIIKGFASAWTHTYCGGLPKKHVGVDLKASVGEDVYATYDGVVRAVYTLSSKHNWGKGVVIEHSGFTTTYMHVNPVVNEGTHVNKGQKIATIGSIEGDIHLHFGVRSSTYSDISKRGALPQKHGDSDYDKEGHFTGCKSDPLFREKFVDPMKLKYEIASKITDKQKQQEILNMVNNHRGSIPPELVLAVIRSEGGEGAFHVDGWNYNAFYREIDGPWAQPTNGDGIMQVSATGNPYYHELSGPYTHDRAGYDHAINDGCDYLLALYNTYGTHVQNTMHYNTGPNSLYIYLGKNWGDRDYLSHVAGHLSNFVPATYGLQNQNLANALNHGQDILNDYLYNKGLATRQSVNYYRPYQEQLDKDLHKSTPSPIPTATLSVSPNPAYVGETITIKVDGKDDTDVKYVSAYYSGNWHRHECTGIQAHCGNSWTTSESSPGSYKYYGYIKDNEGNGAWSTPKYIEVTFNPSSSPPSATLSVSPKEVSVGDPITIKVDGKDDTDVKYVSAYYSGNWHRHECTGIQAHCGNSWTTSESSPGSYKYYGYIKDNEGNGAWSTPKYIEVTFKS